MYFAMQKNQKAALTRAKVSFEKALMHEAQTYLQEAKSRINKDDPNRQQTTLRNSLAKIY
jgi:hypothetical protein